MDSVGTTHIPSLAASVSSASVTPGGKKMVLNPAARSGRIIVSENRTARNRTRLSLTSSWLLLNSTTCPLVDGRVRLVVAPGAGSVGPTGRTAGWAVTSGDTGPISRSSIHTSVGPGP